MIKSINAINVVLDFPYSISMLLRKLHHHPPHTTILLKKGIIKVFITILIV